MYVKGIESQSNLVGLTLLPGVSNFITSRRMYEKLEKQSLQPFWDRPRILLVRHSFSNSEVLGLLCHVIVVNVEHHMLPQFSLSRSL